MYQVYLRNTIKIIDFATMILEFLVDLCVWVSVCFGQITQERKGKERRERKIVDEFKLKQT